MTERFQMVVADVFALPWGVAVTGYIGSGDERRAVRVTRIERFRESLTEATVAPKPMAITLTGIERDQVGNRDLLVSDPTS